MTNSIVEESGLVAFARKELQLAGLFDKDADYGPSLAQCVLDTIGTFSKYGHSGGSAMKTIAILDRLLRFEPLTPLTYAEDEWNEVGPSVWQNRRKSDIFSEDGGKTWYSLNDLPYDTDDIDV